MPVLILHYHEIWLKGCNRRFFLQNLKRASKQALGGLRVENTAWEDHRLLITFGDEETARQGVERLRKVPGIAYMAVAEQTEPRLDSIIETGARLMRDVEFRSFRVRARRSQKSLPFRSIDVGRELGGRIYEDAVAAGREVKVDLDNGEATCYVEVTATRALLYREKIPGVGGLPTGSAGKLTCLLSGGFDSAVAAYKVIKRGVRLRLRPFLGASGAARRRQPARGAGIGAGADAVPGPCAVLLGSLRRDSARDCGVRPRELPHPALPPHDVADRRTDRLSRARPWFSDRRQHFAGGFANTKEHGGRGISGDAADLSALGG